MSDTLGDVITVVGEALIDLVIEHDGSVAAVLGGAPFNAARAAGRLGADVRFVGPLSQDRFGSLLRAQLVDDGVDVTDAPGVVSPTSLAAAEIDRDGSASYRFYTEATSLSEVIDVPTVSPGGVVFTGGLALALEPFASTVEEFLAEAASSSTVVVDVNSRAHAISDRETYLARLRRVLASTDVVKVSDDDLEYLALDVSVVEAARSLLAWGPRVVLLTSGAAGTHILTGRGERVAPTAAVDVVDTIGAGDTFAGAFLAWWHGQPPARRELHDLGALQAAVGAANRVAGVVCTRRGADPPRLDELDQGWGELSAP